MMKLLEPYRLAAVGIILALLLAFAGLGFWRGMAAINAMVETARQDGITTTDAKWQARFEKSNAEVAVKQAEQAINAAAADGAAQLQIAALKTELNDLETANEMLPDAGCSLDANRVRLLNQK
jgi:hypothetical protein